jgi:hypothetical protein
MYLIRKVDSRHKAQGARRTVRTEISYSFLAPCAGYFVSLVLTKPQRICSGIGLIRSIDIIATSLKKQVVIIFQNKTFD